MSGVQELPASQDLYIPQKGSEFREPQHPADWTKDEKLIEEAQTRLKIFVDDDSQKVEKIKAQQFVKNLINNSLPAIII